MSPYPLWPHQLVLNVRYGRWWTFLLIFCLLLALFYAVDAFKINQSAAIPVFFSFVIAYIIPASHYVGEQTLAAFESLGQSLVMTREQRLKIRQSLETETSTVQLQILGVGLTLGLGHNYLLLTNNMDLMTAIYSLGVTEVFFLLITIFIWCLLTSVISFLGANVRTFAKLANRHIRVDLLQSSRLRGFSRVAVYSTLVLLGVLAAFPLLLFQPDTQHITIAPGFLATLLPMMFIFFVPLLPIREQIQQRKQQELALIEEQINQLVDNQEKLAENVSALAKLQPLLMYKHEIEQVPEWPFDSPALLRLMFYLIIPPLTWVGAALIERLIDTLSF